MWPAIIAIAGAVYSGVQANNTEKANANAAEWAAFTNSRNNLTMGIRNANAITKAAMISMASNRAMSFLGAQQDWDIARYNADLKMLVGDYNADILDNEAVTIWEKAGLDVQQIEDESARTKGHILASYGASGAQINATDSVADAMIDESTRSAMNVFIVRHSADIQAQKVHNEAARSRWDGYMAAKQILYEGNLRASGTLIEGGIRNESRMAQAMIDSSATFENSKMGSLSIVNTGNADAQSYRNKGTTAMNNGLFTAAAQSANLYTSSSNGGTGKGITVESNYSPLTSDVGTTEYGSYSGSLLTE